MLNLAAIAATPVTTAPFSFFKTDAVLDAAALHAINRDFPAIRQPGIFPLSELTYGEAFARLIDDIDSDELTQLMSEKFAVDLTNKPLMITVRGHCQKKDGRIHTDSLDKIVTCLLYLNEDWAPAGGRLRLLRNGHDLNDMITEIPPLGGTLVAFKRSDCSWHGHEPYEGQRRYVMFNWVRTQATLAKNVGRHKLSALAKRLNPFAVDDPNVY